MTERDYIDATDIRARDCAIDALKHIVPDNQPVIENEPFRIVIRHLKDWREAIHDAIQARGGVEVEDGDQGPHG
jgi:hypothetical protein